MADFKEIIKGFIGEDGSIPQTAIGTLEQAIKQTVGNEFVEKDRYKAKLSEIDTLKEQMQTVDDHATTAEKWKTKYDALKDEFSEYKKDVSAKEIRSEKESAYKKLLLEAGVSEKRIDTILKVSDVDSVELEDGKIKDADKLTDSIKAEWADFIVDIQDKGANTANPLSNGDKMTSEEFFKMSLNDQMAYANEHPSEVADFM